MQTLYNRIVQTKCACKCSSCFSSVATCARRTTTAVFRSRISSRDRFTVLSSSFLTAATLLDSDIKGRKRRKLLGEIEDAKDELKALDDSQSRRLAALSTECDDVKELASDDSQNHRLAALSAKCDDIKESALDGQCTWDDVLAWAREEKFVRHTLGFEAWKGIPLSIIQSFSTAHIKKLIRHNPNLRRLLDGVETRMDFTPSVKQRKIIEWSSAKLAYYFSQEVYVLDNLSGRHNVADDTETISLPLLDDILQANIIISKIQKLPPNSADIEQAPRPPAPRYSLNHQFDQKSAATLNSSVDEVFQFCWTQGKNLQYLLTYICHLLLASNVAPTIETYILLARNFDELREHRLVQLVLEALQECKFRLDEEALIFFLDYYAKTHSSIGFQLLVDRISGFGNGLGSIRAGVRPGDTPTMLPGIAFDKYRFDKRKMRQSSECSNFAKFNVPKNELCALKYRIARKDQGVYASLIRGTLKFANGTKAMGHYVDLIREGHEPTVEILTAILSQCCDQQDWSSGLRVLYEIQNIAGANLQTYRWILRLCHKCQDKGAYKKSLANGIRRGIIPPAVRLFPEEIEAMEADLLLDFAKEYDELSQECFKRLAGRLGVIINQMAETAFEFGSMTLSHGLSPTIGFFLYTRITYHGANFSRWAAREKNRVARTSDAVLDVASRTPNSLVNVVSGTHEALNKVKLPGISKANSRIKNPVTLRLRRKHTSLWDTLLRILADEFRKLRWLLRKMAQELGNIEPLIRHGPTVGHTLHAKMLLWRAESSDSAEWTEQRSSPLVHDWMKEDQRALPSTRGPIEETKWAKEPAYPEKLLKDDRQLLQRKRHVKLRSETEWEVPDFGKTLNKGSEVKESPSGLGNILREAVHLDNILNI